MKGVDLRTVQELMGHKNIQMTCRYAHLAPEHKQAAVEKLCEATVTTRKTTRKRASEKQSVQAVPTDTRTDTGFAASL